MQKDEIKQATIKKNWLKARQKLIALDIPKGALQDMERMYYLGFVQCFMLLNDHAADLTVQETYELYQRLSQEAITWGMQQSERERN